MAMPETLMSFYKMTLFNLYFLLNFYIRASVTHQPRTTYFVLFILTINLCFVGCWERQVAGLPWLSLQGRWDHRADRGCNSEDKIGNTSRPINTICRRVKSNTSKWHLRQPDTKKNVLNGKKLQYVRGKLEIVQTGRFLYPSCVQAFVLSFG